MLTIRTEQMALIEAQHRAGEPAWALAWLKAQRPAWCSGQSEETLRMFCAVTLDFSHRCGFHARSSLARLLELRADGRLVAPVSDWHRLLLTRAGFDEETRLQQFEQSLDSPARPVLIGLDTDLSTLHRGQAPHPEQGAAGATN